jgi:hypothetical protein
VKQHERFYFLNRRQEGEKTENVTKKKRKEPSRTPAFGNLK